MFSDEELNKKFKSILPHLDEQATRLYLGSEAQILGRGGKQRVAKLAGVSRVRIDKGIAELTAQKAAKEDSTSKKLRKAGGGRKKHKESQSGLIEALESIVTPHTMGDPMKVLLWSSKSLRNIEKLLKEKGYLISYVTIGEILKSIGYSLQGNKKTDEGGNDPDRNKQFEFINKTALAFMADNAPVISVDCKKKELIGNFKNAGTDWFEQGKAPEVKVYDFIDKELGKAVPYGVYDIARNEGWVSVGISKDTAEFAVNSIRSWWQQMGKEQYPLTDKLLVTADGGGSNSSRSKLWKKELQTLSTELGLEVHVCHFPPGTSKWNKIEHRMFSYITKNWRAKPLESLEVIVNLIAHTTTKKGLTIKAEADKNQYEKGLKVDDEASKKINLTNKEFRGEWNYKIDP
ncbi:MAG: ISAzo13 family transposase [Segetibacter sp.]